MKKLFLGLALIITGHVYGQKTAVMQALSKHGIKSDVLDPAIRQRPDSYSFDLKFSSIASDREKITLAKYDASKAGEDRWTVISIDGKTPTASQIKTFKKDHSRPAAASAATIDEASLKVESETPDMLVISYKPDMASLPEDAAFLKDCRNFLTINLKSKHLEKLQTLNEKPLKIKILNADKLDLTVKYTYNEATSSYLPTSEDLVLVVKFLGQSAPVETISEYSNYTKI